MRFYWMTLGLLGVWRVTHLLNAEDGPANLLVRFRRWVGSGLLGSLLDCFLCLSLWIAVPFAFVIGEGWKERILLWLAFSGGAILLQRLYAAPPAVDYYEDEENPDGLLREGQESVSDGRADGSGR